jgi:hypothetical protein|tara:strand:- start:112 stop:372 length:261 start_codon:yes stop_codon:yes gene_type:complete
MAIEKTVEQDKIEVVGPYKAVQVREATVITEDDAELSRNFRRYVLHPDSDISGETAEIQAICNAVWTDDIKTAWTEFQAARPAGPA